MEGTPVKARTLAQECLYLLIAIPHRRVHIVMSWLSNI